MKNKSVAMIGFGKLGSLIGKRMLETGFVKPNQIFLTRGQKDLLPQLALDFPSCVVCASAAEAVSRASLVILAVRPDQLSEVGTEVRAHIAPNHTVLSVVTKKSFQALSEALGTDKLVRVNTNIMLEEGRAISFWQSAPGLAKHRRDLCLRLTRTWGEAIEAADEKQLDVGTIATGCLPAFVMYLQQSLVEAFVELGWPELLAEKVVTSVALSTLERVASGKVSPKDIIAAVKTKGGVTKAGLDKFEAQRLAAIIKAGILAAWDRLEEMG